jgi:hypothetical protein
MTALDRAGSPRLVPVRARDLSRIWALSAAVVDAEPAPSVIEGDRGAGLRRAVVAPASLNGTPAFYLTTHEAARRAYEALADSVGHLPVLDHRHRRWVLVDVAGQLRARRLADEAVPGDARAVLTAHELVDTHGPLFIEPPRASVRMPNVYAPFIADGSENVP